MTWRKREIMDMAREAGLHIATDVNWMPVIGLEYAEKFAKLVREEQQTEVQRLIALVRAQQITIDKLEAALAQPEQEPIGYLCENATGHRYFRWKKPPSVYNPIALYAKP